MGSIADLLGDKLPEDWKETVSGQREGNTGSPDTEESKERSAVIAAVLEETDFDPAKMSPHLRLDRDLELTGLPLWSVVADIERELKTTFPDEQVRGWETLGDLLDAASSK